jgi:hypothetical protein
LIVPICKNNNGVYNKKLSNATFVIYALPHGYESEAIHPSKATNANLEGNNKTLNAEEVTLKATNVTLTAEIVELRKDLASELDTTDCPSSRIRNVSTRCSLRWRICWRTFRLQTQLCPTLWWPPVTLVTTSNKPVASTTVTDPKRTVTTTTEGARS